MFAFIHVWACVYVTVRVCVCVCVFASESFHMFPRVVECTSPSLHLSVVASPTSQKRPIG